MSQIYTDPKRESDPHALPNAEVFEARLVNAICRKGCETVVPDAPGAHLAEGDCPSCGAPIVNVEPEFLDGKPKHGWYWQSCFPGCLPDGDANGPFATEAEAIADAQDGCGHE